MFSKTVAFPRCGFSVTLSVSAQNMANGYHIGQFKNRRSPLSQKILPDNAVLYRMNNYFHKSIMTMFI